MCERGGCVRKDSVRERRVCEERRVFRKDSV